MLLVSKKCGQEKLVNDANLRHYVSRGKLYIKSFSKKYESETQMVRAKTNKSFSKKKYSIVQYLSYSMTDLKKYLESQLDDKMSWDNYGSYWHIDHIIPQSDLPYTSMEDNNFKKCWALVNLRPLNASQNMSEGASRIRHQNMEKNNG